jgi:hypothetical protein
VARVFSIYEDDALQQLIGHASSFSTKLQDAPAESMLQGFAISLHLPRAD